MHSVGAARQDDAERLRRYAEANAEEAIAEFVRRNLGLGDHAGLRQCGRAALRAEDVAPAVFTDLPRKAEELAGRPALAGWLHTSTRLAAAQAAALVTRMWAAAQGWKDGFLTADFAAGADKGGCGGRGWGETETNGGSPQKTPKGAKMDELFFCRQHVARGKGDDGEVGIFNHGWTRMNTDFRSGGERVVGEAPGIHAA